MEAILPLRRKQSPTYPTTEGHAVFHRKTAVLVGLLFIWQMVAAAIGNMLITSYFSGETSGDGTLFTGVLLMAGAGLAVAVIGIAMYPVLRPHGQRLSLAYLVLRVLEFVTVIAIGAYFLTSRAEWKDNLLLVYAFTAPAGLVLSFMLLRSKLVARWLSVLGIVGYGALLVGTTLAALGMVELDSGAGVLFFVPGGLFELVFLPFVLIVKGFRQVGTTTSHA